ncbi:hypothetical protein Avbf_06936 [Armadillidium vulgare]|nr:hypothetical protein Avbf_06936 [Armadillidium vulgare]
MSLFVHMDPLLKFSYIIWMCIFFFNISQRKINENIHFYNEFFVGNKNIFKTLVLVEQYLVFM